MFSFKTIQKEKKGSRCEVRQTRLDTTQFLNLLINRIDGCLNKKDAGKRRDHNENLHISERGMLLHHYRLKDANLYRKNGNCKPSSISEAFVASDACTAVCLPGAPRVKGRAPQFVWYSIVVRLPMLYIPCTGKTQLELTSLGSI